MSPEIVLIVADEPGAGPAQSLVERWKREAEPPMFVQVRAELWNGGAPPQFTLAVVAGLSAPRMAHALARLMAAGKPVICVSDDGEDAIIQSYPSVTFLRRSSEHWDDLVVWFAGEIFGRLRATTRAQRAEQEAASLQTHAALGRYMQDVRHGFNNALTSVLGNSELIMMESDTLHPRMREQVESIYNMAMRMHQVMQRFTSLETEMKMAESPSQGETKPTAGAVAASV
jgi:signal transduction histidine kinase